MNTASYETPLFIIAAAFYALAALDAVVEAKRRGDGYTRPLVLLGVALAFNAVSIVLRWIRLDHGPYVDLRETLVSSIWGYHLALAVTALTIRRVRPILAPTLPLLLVMVVWALFVPVRDRLMPVTYDTIWLPIHILIGKVFIGCIVVALGLGFIVIARNLSAKRGLGENSALRFVSMPGDAALDELAFRFMLAGFVFETMMLISGAIWAQDAWGRYWAWDPLETWSFLTWISVGIYLHLRITRKTPPVIGAILVTVSFALAYLTFFGIPFFSQVAHQGVV